MIDLLELKHFKCFELLKLPLASLTVLSGTNASGKSSILQVLALLHQTMRDHEWSGHVALNGSDVQLGTVSDVVDQAHGRGRFEVGLSDNNVRCNWSFTGERRDMSARLERVEVGDESIEILQRPGNHLRYLLPDPIPSDTAARLTATIQDLAYITAERRGPRETYPLIDDRNNVGTQGEYAVSALFNGSDEQVAEHLRIKDDAAPTLAHQVEARMDSFFPGCRISVSQVENANAVVLGIRTSENTGFLRPVHSGFGITQILPIVVAVLSARASLHDNPLILIENPEVHLHPSGQALMGQFLAEAAHAGVQIIAETHSDHVLNGVRRAVKSGKAKADEVAIHFFQDRFRNESQVLSPMLDPSGNIDVWPDGFFDQFDKDLDYFAGWGE